MPRVSAKRIEKLRGQVLPLEDFSRLRLQVCEGDGYIFDLYNNKPKLSVFISITFAREAGANRAHSTTFRSRTRSAKGAHDV